MKKLMALSLIFFLTACGGGYEDIDFINDPTIKNPHNDSFGTVNGRPNVAEEKSRWQYSTIATGGKDFSLKANNHALNYFYEPASTHIKNTPWVVLEKRREGDDSVSESVSIFVSSPIPCLPFCDVRINFDGQWGSYRMQNSMDGVIEPIDDATEITLFKKFTSTNRATIRLPVVGSSRPFDANFDLRGYDIKRMKF